MKIISHPFYFFAFLLLFSFGCARRCAVSQIDFSSPYSNPVWHPDGKILGFNRIPVAHRYKDPDPCGFDSYDYVMDSIGFWLIDKDGKNLRRALSFQVDCPAWSPDGKWFAFCEGSDIWKMPFDDEKFDTTHVIRLTNNGGNNFNPSWSANSDTIYYDSDELERGQFRVFKMAADGSGRRIIGNKMVDTSYSREPHFVNSNLILHIRADNKKSHVYSMDTNGDNVRKVTDNNRLSLYIHLPNYYNSKVYYEDNGVWSSNLDGTNLKELVHRSWQGFSISKDGTIAYVVFDGKNIDETNGVIMLMDENGKNKRQLTYNKL